MRKYTVMKRQYIIFDALALLADIGGYMGLLLGYSILSPYKSATPALTWCLKKFKNGYCKKKRAEGS